jgi:D-alanine-D-alanine ligase-like ATP-grasp enzyme
MLIEAQRIAFRLGHLWTSFRNGSGQIYVQDRVPEYRRIWSGAAEAIGATFKDIADNVWEVEKNGRHTRILNYLVEFDNPVTLELVGSKPLVKKLLSDNGVPVPPGEVFSLADLAKARDFLNHHRDGCVVKPAKDTSAGRGITTHITSRRRLRRAAVLASLYDRALMIEEQVKGETCRGLVLNGRMIHAVRRAGPRLRGDGTSTVRRLVEKHNAASPAGDGIVVDEDCVFTLRYQDLTPESVPSSGREFVVRSGGEASRKGVEVRTVYNEDITDRVGDGFRAVVERVAQVIGAKFVGVDLVTRDITAGLESCGGAVLEVNATPGMHHHYDAETEPYPKPAVDVLNALLDISGS